MSGHTSRPLQVSYGASTDQLSNREVFPSFFRTVPSDRVQAVAMVELLQEFRWNWVAALGSDDEYGRQGLSLFSSLANTRGVCIAHEGLVPLSHATAAQGDATQTLLQQVNQSSVQVVVLFASARAARTLFSYSIRSGLSPKVWVASEAWLTSDLVMTLPGMAQMGTVLGFLQRGAPLPEFSSYVHTRLALAADPAHCASLEAEQPGLEEQVVGPRCPQCDHITPENVSADLPHHQAFAAYAAVYSVAQALHNTLLCNASGCRSRERVQPWQVRPLRAPGPRAGGAGPEPGRPRPPALSAQLLENMKNLTFRPHGLAMRFDASGNVEMGYDLKLWVWQDRKPLTLTVGAFDGSLQLQRSRMRWHTPGGEVSARPLSPAARGSLTQGQERPLAPPAGSGGPSPGPGQVHAAEQSLSPEAPVPGACVPVLTAVRGGPGAPSKRFPLLLLRLRGLQGGQLQEQLR